MFLQGVGGYSLAIPFLASLAPKAQAQSSAPAMRYAMVLGKLGRDMSQWYPNVEESRLQTVPGARVLPFSQIQKPISYCISDQFNPVLNKMSLIRGLDCMSTQGNHNASVPTTGSSVDPSGPVGFGYSIDCVLEESAKFYPTVPVLGGLRVCPDISYPYHEFQSFSYTSKTVTGQMVLPEWNPLAVYNKLLDPSGVQTTNAQRARLRSVTDSVMENYRATMGSRVIATEDKHRLDNYMTLLSDVHNQLNTTLKNCSIAGNPGTPTVLSQIHKAMMKLEAAALACGVTKISMHIIAHNGDDQPPLWHQHAHGGEYTINDATGRSFLSEYCKWNMDLVAYFLKELDSIQESNGTLLDNTLFVYGNEDGTGSHEHFDLPVIVAGGQGKMKLGHFIDYRARPFVPVIAQREKQRIYAGRPYNSMLVTAFQAMGLTPTDYQKFGTQGFGRYDKGPIAASGYYNQYMGSHLNDPLPFLFQG
jgi:hypothetical protein